MAEGTADDSCQRVGYLFHYMNKEDLKPGDHVYCFRGIYTHHGIYIGEPDCEVIHFTGGKKGSSLKILNSSGENSLISALKNLIYSYNDKEDISDEDIEEFCRISIISNDPNAQTIIEEYRALQINPSSDRLEELKKTIRQTIDTIHIKKTTLDRFCNGNWIRLVAYRHISCYKFGYSTHKVKAMPMEETVKLAKYFLDHPTEIGSYDLFNNNCETFACFCKTGLMDNVAAQLHPLRDESIPSFNTAKEALQNYRDKQKTDKQKTDKQ